MTIKEMFQNKDNLKIEVITSGSCSHCSVLKVLLADNEFSFDELPFDQNMERMIELEQTGIPVLIVNGVVIKNPISNIKEYLGYR